MTQTANPWRLKATPPSESVEVPPADQHPAVCVALIDLGTHQDEYQDSGKKFHVRRVLIVWELTACRKAGTKTANHVVCKDYNLFFGPTSALRKLVEGWRGAGFKEGDDFDISKLLGQKCLINLTHGKSARGSAYAKLASVGKLPKGLECPEPQHKPVAWVVGSEEPLPAWLPYLYGEPVADVINRCLELNGGVDQAAGDQGGADSQGTGGDEEIPF